MPSVALVYVVLAVVLAILIPKLAHNARPAVCGFDALSYLAEALPFAEQRSIEAANDFRGKPDGSLRGETHSFLYPAFLSHALLNCGNRQVGFPNDHAARVAFQVTFLYLLLAIAAAAGVVRYAGVGALAVLLVLQVPQYEYISSNASRDAFRIIPLMLLLAILAGLSPRRMRVAKMVHTVWAPFALAAWSLTGHVLGGFVVVMLTLAWLAWNVARLNIGLRTLAITAALAMGALLGAEDRFAALLETGSVLGDNAYENDAVAGTPLEELWEKWEDSRLEGTADVVKRIGVHLARDQGRMSVPGLLIAVGVLVWWVRRGFPTRRHADSIPFLALSTLSVALLFTDLFQTSHFNLSEWFVRNFRYALHWYPMAAVCVSTSLTHAYASWSRQRGVAARPSAASSPARASHVSRGSTAVVGALGRRRAPFAVRLSVQFMQLRILASFEARSRPADRRSGLGKPVAAILIVTLIGASALSTLASPAWQVVSPGAANTAVAENVRALERAVRDLPAGDRLLLQDDRFNYYLRNRAMLLFCRPGRQVFRARSSEELLDIVDRLGIGAVALENVLLPGFLDQSVLLDTLTNPRHALPLARTSSLSVFEMESRGDEEALLERSSCVVVSPNDRWDGPSAGEVRLLEEAVPGLSVTTENGGFQFARVRGGDGLQVVSIRPAVETGGLLTALSRLATRGGRCSAQPRTDPKAYPSDDYGGEVVPAYDECEPLEGASTANRNDKSSIQLEIDVAEIGLDVESLAGCHVVATITSPRGTEPPGECVLSITEQVEEGSPAVETKRRQLIRQKMPTGQLRKGIRPGASKVVVGLQWSPTFSQRELQIQHWEIRVEDPHAAPRKTCEPRPETAGQRSGRESRRS